MKTLYDVVIVGAGPVGLTFANFIAKYGHTVCVLEKEKNLFDNPRAVAIDDESLRIWQQINVLDKMKPYIEYGNTGEEVVTYFSSSGKKMMSIFQDGKEFGYAKGAVILQHEIDKILLHSLKKFHKNVDILFDHNIQSFTNTSDSVNVYAKHNNKNISITGKYLIACDGGKSTIRKNLNIKMRGFTYPESWLIVDTIEERKERMGAAFFCDSKQSIATIPMPKNHRRFEILLKEKEQSFSESDIKHLLKKLQSFKIKKILRHIIFKFSARIAEKYRMGRVFLAGDAAHVTPPFVGQGLPTGLRDVANLSWKLSECIKGNFKDDLLDTYQIERKPHQKKMIKLAVMLGKFMTPKNKLSELWHGFILNAISKIKPLRRLIELRGKNIQPFYKRGFIKKGNLAGRYFPQPSFMTGKNHKLFDELLGDKFTIISFDTAPDNFLSSDEIKNWKMKGAKFLKIPKDKFVLFRKFIDLSKKHLFIVRPERIIYAHYKK